MALLVITPGVLDSLYNWLYECAHNGSVCPSNQDICDRYGLKSEATASGAVRKLQDQGRITVMRFNRSRQVYIVATKKLTPMPKATIGLGYLPMLPALRISNAPKADVRRNRTTDLPKPPTVPTPAKPPRARVSPASTDLPKPTQASLPNRTPPKFRLGHTTAPERKLGDHRTRELAEIAEFEARGKVYKARMGESSEEFDEIGRSVEASARMQAAAVKKAAARAAKTQAILRSMSAKK